MSAAAPEALEIMVLTVGRRLLMAEPEVMWSAWQCVFTTYFRSKPSSSMSAKSRSSIPRTGSINTASRLAVQPTRYVKVELPWLSKSCWITRLLPAISRWPFLSPDGSPGSCSNTQSRTGPHSEHCVKNLRSRSRARTAADSLFLPCTLASCSKRAAPARLPEVHCTINGRGSRAMAANTASASAAVGAEPEVGDGTGTTSSRQPTASSSSLCRSVCSAWLRYSQPWYRGAS
mmetsp:Transcript_4210/g.10126  ORF Transcript_4210/g.10126 Transcript_4210/m.10126 type:complete len:232 (+) Transcript_4210:616-1311(+)